MTDKMMPRYHDRFKANVCPVTGKKVGEVPMVELPVKFSMRQRTQSINISLEYLIGSEAMKHPMIERRLESMKRASERLEELAEKRRARNDAVHNASKAQQATEGFVEITENPQEKEEKPAYVMVSELPDKLSLAKTAVNAMAKKLKVSIIEVDGGKAVSIEDFEALSQESRVIHAKRRKEAAEAKEKEETTEEETTEDETQAPEDDKE